MTTTQQQPVLPAVADILGSAAEGCETLDLGAGLTATVIVRPGAVLNHSAQERVYAALIPVTTSSFGADMTPYWAQRSKEGYLERLAEFVLIADEDGRMVGWTGFHVLPYDGFTLVYLDSTGMVPTRQSGGVMRQLMQARVSGSVAGCPAGKPVYLTARTESPIFYRLMRRLLPAPDALYPQPATAAPGDVVEAARHLARWLGQQDILDAPALTVRGAYDALDELYGELPTTGDPELDKLFRGQLGPLDAFLLVGRVR
ncbi:GNAT family N-acetyltransferase [Peterkaempfera griseoplana]|uniref:GNAT family N-acetyltransferase n=1 Tax=Peterkaempfera griseoplana TaxID=66896 RepID=UPI0006E43123|nr:GNAT family N-acetyltransferase [Peterkaempfera griseoplana]BCN13445.1 GNAT-family N-acetyltransferase [Peterkaempfera griseoplana]